MDAAKIKMSDSQLPETFTRADRDKIIEVSIKTNEILRRFDSLENNAIRRIDALESEKAAREDLEKIYATRNVKWESIDKRIELLEKGKADSCDVQSVAKRTTKLENYRWFIGGIVALAGIVVTLVIYIYFHDIGQLQAALEKHEDNSTKILEQLRQRVDGHQ